MTMTITMTMMMMMAMTMTMNMTMMMMMMMMMPGPAVPLAGWPGELQGREVAPVQRDTGLLQARGDGRTLHVLRHEADQAPQGQGLQGEQEVSLQTEYLPIEVFINSIQLIFN